MTHEGWRVVLLNPNTINQSVDNALVQIFFDNYDKKLFCPYI